MKRNKIKLIAMLLCLILAVSMLSACDLSYPSNYRGKCGDGLKWTLTDDDNGVLTISGKGRMYDKYRFEAWDNSIVKTILIEDGVENISNNAFENCSSLTNVTISGRVTEIGYCALEGCTSLESIKFTGDAPYIDDYAFLENHFTVYYPADNDTWKDVVERNEEFNGYYIKWKAYDPNS